LTVVCPTERTFGKLAGLPGERCAQKENPKGLQRLRSRDVTFSAPRLGSLPGTSFKRPLIIIQKAPPSDERVRLVGRPIHKKEERDEILAAESTYTQPTTT
jgi:hypothetical protein